MLRRKIVVYNFQTAEETVLETIKDACNFTQKSYTEVAYMLDNPDARIHELVDSIKNNTISEVTRRVVMNTQTYECRWHLPYAMRAIRVIKERGSALYEMIDDVHYFKTIIELAEFLGVSRQAVYNRRCRTPNSVKPIKAKSGEYYVLDFGVLNDVKDSKDVIVDKGYIAKVIYNDGRPEVTQISYSPYDLYIWCCKVSPIKVNMSFEEFMLSCKYLTPISEAQQDALVNEEYSWIDELTQPRLKSRFGFPVVYDYLTAGSKTFTTGVLVARIV